MTFKDDLREVLKDIMSKADNYNGLEEEYENAALDTAQSQITKLVEGLIDTNKMGEYFSRRIGEIVSCKYCMPSDSKRRFLLKEFIEEIEELRAELRKGVEG